jgi:hypothetical protein
MRIDEVEIGQQVILHCPQARRVTRYPGTLRQFADLEALRAMAIRPDAIFAFATPPTPGNFAIFEADAGPRVKGFVCLKITETGLFDDEGRKVYLEPGENVDGR